MKKILLFTFSLLAMLGSANAQNSSKCGSNEILKKLELANPGLNQRLLDIAQIASDKKTRGTTIYIPVVVHIVYKNATENLTDNYVTGQIDLLNRSYARLNSDTTNTRSIFQNIVGPTDVRFVLAQIKRVSTTTQGFLFDYDFQNNNYADYVKKTANGGSDAVQPDKNLNIWVCDITLPSSQPGELLGYAYPPPGLSQWGGSGYPYQAVDGVVIDYVAFGGTGRLPLGSSSGLKGKTCVHEVGHYLGLRHIWGDDAGACQGDIGFEDDGINDTPHAADMSNFDCDKVKNTCNQGSGDLPDMVENYMDYSAETCQNSFTKGQSAMMTYVLTNIRTGIRVPTGIEELAISNKINVYPNPTNESIAINFSDIDFKTAIIELKDITGKTLLSEKISNINSAITINGLSKFRNGMYIVTINVNNLKINKSIIINN